MIVFRAWLEVAVKVDEPRWREGMRAAGIVK